MSLSPSQLDLTAGVSHYLHVKGIGDTVLGPFSDQEQAGLYLKEMTDRGDVVTESAIYRSDDLRLLELRGNGALFGTPAQDRITYEFVKAGLEPKVMIQTAQQHRDDRLEEQCWSAGADQPDLTAGVSHYLHVQDFVDAAIGPFATEEQADAYYDEIKARGASAAKKGVYGDLSSELLALRVRNALFLTVEEDRAAYVKECQWLAGLDQLEAQPA